MSSRQEEKEKRRREREAQEAAAAKAAANSRRIQMVFAVVLVIAILGGGAALIASGGGGGDGGSADNSTAETKVPIPAVKTTDLAQAAKLAKCTVTNPAIEGSTHVTDQVTYKTNPPSSGNHNPTPAPDGIYDPGNEPAKENYVHSLEHGRIEIQYAPGSPKKTVDELETVGSEELNGTAAYHVLVFQNNTGMPFKVAAVAWGHILGCPAMNDQVFDAIRAFRKQYTDKGPELVP